MTMETKTVHDSRIASVVSALVDQGLVASTHRAEAVGVVDRVLAQQSRARPPMKRRFAELAGYLGGTLVVAAAAIFCAAQWDGLGPAMRIAVLTGVAVVLALTGLAVRPTDGVRSTGAGTGAGTGADPVRRRLAGALLTAAAGSAAAAVGLLVHQQGGARDSTSVLAGFLTLAVLSLLGYRVAPTVVGQLGVAVGAATAAPVALERLGSDSAVATGLAIAAVGVAWLLATERGLWREVDSARVVGCGLVLLGAQLPVLAYGEERWVGYLLLAVVAVVAFATYVLRPAWPYLALGVLAVSMVVPEALLDWTDDAVGPAGAMLATGISLLGASLLGLRLRRDTADRSA